MPLFYEFPEDRYWVGAPRLVAVGPAEFVRTYIAEEGLLRAFGGYLHYIDPATGGEFVGVWDAAAIVRFYKGLRARGASFKVSHERPPKLRLLTRRA